MSTPSPYLALEHDICSAHHMALILADLFDDTLRMFKSVADETNSQTFKVLLNSPEIDTLSFAYNDVVARTKVVKDSFYEIDEERAS